MRNIATGFFREGSENPNLSATHRVRIYALADGRSMESRSGGVCAYYCESPAHRLIAASWRLKNNDYISGVHHGHFSRKGQTRIIQKIDNGVGAGCALKKSEWKEGKGRRRASNGREVKRRKWAERRRSGQGRLDSEERRSESYHRERESRKGRS